jgi:Lipocalin-like domain
MKRGGIALIAASAWLWSNCSAISAEGPSSIIGTWQITSLAVSILDTNETSYPIGEHPVGYLQYSPGGHMVVFLAADNIRQPASALYTDLERAEIHKAILGAYSGTYRVEGGVVIHHVLASWWPHFIGTDQIRYFEIKGNKLTIKSAPQKFPATGKDSVISVTFERVE